ncbi:MAG: hypothetical protein WC758_07475 [Candidatus Woesearchaeota archaeon]|jgi:hypothetical protein
MVKKIDNKNKGCGELFKPEFFGVTCGEISPLTGKIMLCEDCENKSIIKKDKKLAAEIKKNSKYFEVKKKRTHGLLFKEYKLTGKIICECGKEFKEREELFEHLSDVKENEDIFTCKDCNKQLKGMKEVREHYEKERHYSYNLEGTKLGVCFV